MSEYDNKKPILIKKLDLLNLLKTELSDRYPLELLNSEQQQILIEKKWDINQEHNNITYSDESYEKLAEALIIFKNTSIEFNQKAVYGSIINIEENNGKLRFNCSDMQLLINYLISLHKNKNNSFFMVSENEETILKKNNIKYIENIPFLENKGKFNQEIIDVEKIVNNHINFNITTQKYKNTQRSLENELDNLFILLEGYHDEFVEINTTEMKVKRIVGASIYLKSKIPQLSKEKCVDLLKMYGVSFYILYAMIFELEGEQLEKYSDLENYKDIMSAMGKEIQANKYMDLGFDYKGKNKNKTYFMYKLLILNLDAVYYMTSKYSDIYGFLDMLSKETFALKVSNLLYKTGRLDYGSVTINNLESKLFTNAGFYMAKYIESPHKNFPTPKIAQTIRAFIIDVKNENGNLQDSFKLNKSIEMSDNFLLNFVGIKNPKVMDYIVKKIVERQEGYDDIKLVGFVLANIKDKENPLLKKILEIFQEKKAVALITNDDLYKLYSLDEVFKIYQQLDLRGFQHIQCSAFFINKIFENIRSVEEYDKNEQLINNAFKIIENHLKNEDITVDIINSLIMNFSGFIHLNKIDHNLLKKDIENYKIKTLYKNKYYAIEEEKFIDIEQENNNMYIFNKNFDKIKILIANKSFGLNRYSTSRDVDGVLYIMNEKIIKNMKIESFFEITKESAFSFVENNEKFNKYMIENVENVYEIIEDILFKGLNVQDKQMYVENYYSKLLYENKINFEYLNEKGRLLKIFKIMGKSLEIPYVNENVDTLFQRIGDSIKLAYNNNIEINIKFSNNDQTLLACKRLLSNEKDENIKNYIVRVCCDGLFAHKVTDISFAKNLEAIESLGYSITPDQFLIMAERFVMNEKNTENFTVLMGLANGFLNVEEIEYLRDEVLKNSLLGKTQGVEFLKEGIKRFLNEKDLSQNLLNTDKEEVVAKKKKI